MQQSTSDMLNALGKDWWLLPWVLMVAQYIFSAFISSLEMPDTSSGAGYRFFFKFVNALAANISRAKAAGQPSLVDNVISQRVTTTKTTSAVVPDETIEHIEEKKKDV